MHIVINMDCGKQILIKYKEESNMKYRCMACGYIYDDDVEETKFEELPEDWTCPLCGVGKDMFEKVD